MAKQTKYDYEEKIEDVDEIVGTDIKINPDYYVHNAIVKAQQALMNPDVKTGFLQFRVMIENVEILCRASGMIPNDFDEKVNQYKETAEYKESDDKIKSVKLANHKLQLMLKGVFRAKTITSPMRI